ncbi:hypothetical protein AMS68_006968 [Peltaster fructicola]|uniref:HMG box domain-containing protein n=1 Tax=Peltaster fructicola TaxID=286661 RepID=A0A6H0Y3G1_9PEZI|nr:hypothetical protein AMS68_006968 [Peltaster fructicola]
MLGRHVAAVLHGSANTQLVKPLSTTFTTRLSIRVAPVSHRRLYATPSRPKKAVGEASRPIKRTPKVTSPEAAAKKEADAKKAAEKKTALAEKKKALAAKKKATAEKKKLTAAKKKLDAEKKKAAAAKKKATKGEAGKQQAVKLEIQNLKKAALNPPPGYHATSAWTHFLKDQHAKTANEYEGLASQERISRASKTIAERWKNITPAEREHYNHIASTTNDERKTAYKAWVLAHSAEDIQLANTARRALRRRLEANLTRGHRSKWPRIEDERGLKPPVSAFIRFSVNRRASGDFKAIKPSEAQKLIGAEWKALADNEKKKYEAIASKDRDQYYHDYSHVYGHEAPSQQTASAAA